MKLPLGWLVPSWNSNHVIINNIINLSQHRLGLFVYSSSSLFYLLIQNTLSAAVLKVMYTFRRELLLRLHYVSGQACSDITFTDTKLLTTHTKWHNFSWFDSQDVKILDAVRTVILKASDISVIYRPKTISHFYSCNKCTN